MQKKDEFRLLLEGMSRDSITNAIELRSASAKIIKKWVNLKFDYPNEIIDRFIYIESSIEDSISNNLHDAVALENECSEAYKFHIENFLQALEQLRSAIESSKDI